MLLALNMQVALRKMAEQVRDSWHKQQVHNEPEGSDEVVIHLHNLHALFGTAQMLESYWAYASS
jgi:hypothetical protein